MKLLLLALALLTLAWFRVRVTFRPYEPDDPPMFV